MSNINFRIIEKDICADIPDTAGGDSEVVDLFGGSGGASHYSCEAVYDVQTPTAKTFDSGVASSLIEQSITFTAVERGEAGDDITITLQGTTDPDIPFDITVVGLDIVIQLETDNGGVVVTDADALVAAFNIDPAASALVVASGTGNTPLTDQTIQNLAGGVDSEVDVDASTITIPSHGYPDGFKVRLTTDGTLPDPFLTATDYFVIAVDENTIQLASSLVNALAGAEITIVDQGSSGATNTVTGVALAGASVTFQKSNDGVNWINIQSATSVSSDGAVMIDQPNVSYRYMKIVKAITAGVVNLKGLILVIGDGE